MSQSDCLLESLSDESQLAFSSTLLHEIAHAKGGKEDITREFENDLTDLLGLVAIGALKP